jgi:hypothetical protein
MGRIDTSSDGLGKALNLLVERRVGAAPVIDKRG